MLLLFPHLCLSLHIAWLSIYVCCVKSLINFRASLFFSWFFLADRKEAVMIERSIIPVDVEHDFVRACVSARDLFFPCHLGLFLVLLIYFLSIFSLNPFFPRSFAILSLKFGCFSLSLRLCMAWSPDSFHSSSGSYTVPIGTSKRQNNSNKTVSR